MIRLGRFREFVGFICHSAIRTIFSGELIKFVHIGAYNHAGVNELTNIRLRNLAEIGFSPK